MHKDIILRIKNEFLIKNKLTVAIDGRAGSGKSALAKALSKEFDCNIFKTDDFFLPDGLRTPQRLSELGGNIDYDRFRAEIIDNIKLKKDFYYNKYDCGTGRFIRSGHIKYRPLNIVEGSYSMHDKFIDAYDLTVFLDVAYEEQLRRIENRDGAELLQRFIHEWLPMEEKYFKGMRIKEKADVYKLTIGD